MRVRARERAKDWRSSQLITQLLSPSMHKRDCLKNLSRNLVYLRRYKGRFPKNKARFPPKNEQILNNNRYFPEDTKDISQKTRDIFSKTKDILQKTTDVSKKQGTYSQ